MFKMLVRTFYALLLASKESFTGSGASGHWCLCVCAINCAVPAARLFSSSAEMAAAWSSLTASPGSSSRLCAARRVFIPPQTVVEGGFAIDTLCYCEAVIPLRSETSCLGCCGKDRTATALQVALEDQLKPSWESASRRPSSYGCYRGREVLWPSLSHSSLETQQWRLDSPWDLGESVLFFRSLVLFLS